MAQEKPKLSRQQTIAPDEDSASQAAARRSRTATSDSISRTSSTATNAVRIASQIVTLFIVRRATI